MNPSADLAPVMERSVVLQPCSEACAGFRTYGRDGWHDYGICGNPVSPRHGYPARIGCDCRYFCPAGNALPAASAEPDLDS